MSTNWSTLPAFEAAPKAAPNAVPKGSVQSDPARGSVDFTSLIARETTSAEVSQSALGEDGTQPRSLTDQLSDLIKQQIVHARQDGAKAFRPGEGPEVSRPGVLLEDVKVTDRLPDEAPSGQPIVPGDGKIEGGNTTAISMPDRQGVELGDVEIAGGVDRTTPQPAQPRLKEPHAPVSEIPSRQMPPDRQGVELGDVEVSGGIDGAVPQPVQPGGKQPEAPVSEIPGRLTPPDRQGVELGDVELAGGIDRATPQPVQPDVKKEPGAPVSEIPGRQTPPDRQGVELGDVELAGGIDRSVPHPNPPGEAKARTSDAKPSDPPLQSTTTLAADLTVQAGAKSAEAGLKDGPDGAPRAPGELVRELAQSARAVEKPAAEPGSNPGRVSELAARVSNEPASIAVPQTAKPAPASALQALLATAHLPSSMAAALPGELRPLVSLDAISAEGADLEAELSLEAQTIRAEARAEAARASLPHGASATRFTPQTVQSLAARIAARQADGARVFDIRMDPPELGRVEVRLEVGTDRAVRAHLMAERPDTLAELQRYARDLERALEAAGLDLEQGGLDFSLSSDAGSDFGFGDDNQGAEAPASTYELDQLARDAASPSETHVHHYGFELTARRGLDVRT